MAPKVKWITFLILGYSFLLVPLGYAARPDMKQDASKGLTDKKGPRMEELYEDLNLTADQRKQLEENKTKNREKIKTLFEGVRDKMNDLRDELQKDTLNMERIAQLNTELKALQAQIADNRLEGILEVRKILTPEQFKKFIARMDERRGHLRSPWSEGKPGARGDRKK